MQATIHTLKHDIEVSNSIQATLQFIITIDTNGKLSCLTRNFNPLLFQAYEYIYTAIYEVTRVMKPPNCGRGIV